MSQPNPPSTDLTAPEDLTVTLDNGKTVELDLQGALLIAAMASAEKDRLEMIRTEAKAIVLHHLTDLHRGPSKTKTVDAVLPDGRKYLQATLPESSDTSEVANPDAFLEWVEEHYDTEVEYISRVREAFQKRVLARSIVWMSDPRPEAQAKRDAGEDVPLVPIYTGDGPGSGTIVPGVRFKPGATDYTTYRPTWFKPKAGAARTEDSATGKELLENFMRGRSVKQVLQDALDAIEAAEAETVAVEG